MIHLIVGNTGSGKTTYSNKLKKEKNAIIFSIDTWNKTLFLKDKTEKGGINWFLERIERAESLILDYVKQLESIGVDAILDLGLSKYKHRQKFRNFAKANNFDIKLHFLDVSKEERFKRITNRNTEQGETFEFKVSKADFDFMENWFEKPTDEELVDGKIIL